MTMGFGMRQVITEKPECSASVDRADTRVVPLTQLPKGARGRLATCDLPDGDACCLRAMGLRPESILKLCRGGHTCIVEVCDAHAGVGGHRIGLTRDIAKRVQVHPVDE
jgi:Fe2+ transport system protein FeoA